MSIVHTLSQTEQIEYYLGKDQYPNLFFGSELPDAMSVPRARREFTNGVPWDTCRDTVITHDGIDYRFNNLGYRCPYDYHLADLRQKKNILCVGDSDVFGPYKPYGQVWIAHLQRLMPDHNIMPMGLPGWSADTVSRTIVSTVKALGQSLVHVCAIWPQNNRREFVKKGYKKIIGNGEEEITDVPFEDYWDQIDWVSNNYNYHKNCELARYACQAHGIGYTDLLIVTLGRYAKFDGERFGKGVMGPLSHEAMSRWFYKKITGQPSLYESLRRK